MAKKTPLEKVVDFLEPLAVKHDTLGYMYWVTESIDGSKIDDENMQQHGGLEEYCEDCIASAVETKHREWAIERNVLMGQIYEAEQKGFYTYYGFSNARGSKYVFRKVKTTPNHIAGMKRKLKKEFRIGHKFSQDGMRLVMHETEGFRSCESCGKMFDTSLLLTDQELEHWEGLTDDAFKNIEPREAYELDAIFREGGYDTHKLHDRVVKLAERISKLIAI